VERHFQTTGVGGCCDQWNELLNSEVFYHTKLEWRLKLYNALSVTQFSKLRELMKGKGMEGEVGKAELKLLSVFTRDLASG
jgi:hypothetical protein